MCSPAHTHAVRLDSGLFFFLALRSQEVNIKSFYLLLACAPSHTNARRFPEARAYNCEPLKRLFGNTDKNSPYRCFLALNTRSLTDSLFRVKQFLGDLVSHRGKQKISRWNQRKLLFSAAALQLHNNEKKRMKSEAFLHSPTSNCTVN